MGNPGHPALRSEPRQATMSYSIPLGRHNAGHTAGACRCQHAPSGQNSRAATSDSPQTKPGCLVQGPCGQGPASADTRLPPAHAVAPAGDLWHQQCSGQAVNLCCKLVVLDVRHSRRKVGNWSSSGAGAIWIYNRAGRSGITQTC